MAFLNYTPECYPQRAAEELSIMFGSPVPASPVDHASCPGRHTEPPVDGEPVFGGWICPCSCHQDD